jgi:hypothetical protein
LLFICIICLHVLPSIPSYHAVHWRLVPHPLPPPTMLLLPPPPPLLLQAADCLANGMLVPRDADAAFKWYTRASTMGSAAASLKCGVHYFMGEPPTGELEVMEA